MLPDPAEMHVQDVARHLPGKSHFMGDEDHRHAAARQVFDDLQHFAGQLRIKRGCDFVEQHDLRLHGQRPGDCSSLLLAAGQLLRVERGFLGKPYPAETVERYIPGFGLAQLLDAGQRQRSVFQDGQMREQVIALEDNANVAAKCTLVEVRRMNLVPANLDLAALNGLQRIDASQSRRLARTGLSDDGNHLAGFDREGDTVQDLQRAKALADIG